ncbi:uncharacterized protein LOC134529397 [Bacillus rossius redtenbacheri]|uniref:uncharacterized protein LOC134529397 n=1 Tax=Bacillus rossius redtenbacheri TaxID=93214 RepID=UPI002FDD133E
MHLLSSALLLAAVISLEGLAADEGSSTVAPTSPDVMTTTTAPTAQQGDAAAGTTMAGTTMVAGEAAGMAPVSADTAAGGAGRQPTAPHLVLAALLAGLLGSSRLARAA